MSTGERSPPFSFFTLHFLGCFFYFSDSIVMPPFMPLWISWHKDTPHMCDLIAWSATMNSSRNHEHRWEPPFPFLYYISLSNVLFYQFNCYTTLWISPAGTDTNTPSSTASRSIKHERWVKNTSFPFLHYISWTIFYFSNSSGTSPSVLLWVGSTDTTWRCQLKCPIHHKQQKQLLQAQEEKPAPSQFLHLIVQWTIFN